MKTILLWLLLQGTAITVSAALAPSATPTGSAPLKQWPGYSGSNSPHAGIALTQQEWERMWSSVRKEPPQELNMAKEMGVIVHIGERPSGGYHVQVLNAYVEGDRYVIEFKEKTPGPNDVVLAVLTQPWVIALVPRSELRVLFREIS